MPAYATSSSRWPRNSSDAFTAVRDTGGLRSGVLKAKRLSYSGGV